MYLTSISGVKQGLFVSRPSRFTVVLDAGGSRLSCHLHDPGRLHHLLRPGAVVYYRDAWRPGRVTGCDVVAVEAPSRVLVLEDTRLGNKLFPLVAGLLIPWARGLRAEQWINGTRIDFVSADETGRPVLIEVKSTNLVEDAAALFPDAPSRRARRQVEILLAASRAGARGVIVFTVLREDAEELRINRAIDPGLARLICANRSKLGLYAYRVEPRLVGNEIRIDYGGEIPVNPC